MDLDRLNPAQLEAVCAGDAPLLVLAGAGSGKTTVITYRIARLIEERGIDAKRILAVTFTNKAAREMRERVGRLTGLDPRQLDIGTFHGICGRLLRRYGERVGVPPSFIIYDQDDQLALIRRALGELKLDAQQLSPQAVRYRLEQWKNQGEAPEDVRITDFDYVGKRALDVYRLYQKMCLAAGAVDFGDMLLHVVTLLKRHEDARALLQRRWSHVLVDEYQDTNHVQYLLLRHLVTPAHSLTVVGDDDQSIYRWRGADIGNILRFERDFLGAHIVRLEQNYRSTGAILDAANAVIAHNTARKGKTLFTKGERGKNITLRIFESERDEGEAIAESIRQAIDAGTPADEVGVLYRINSQSRPLEDGLRRRRIPYAVYGGVRFYDRREIKDALAYLRLLVNPASDVDFLRVVNAPARGIGKTTLERLLTSARQHGGSLYEAAVRVASGEEQLAGRAKKALAAFVEMMEALRLHAHSQHLARLLERVLEDTGYLQALHAEATDEAQDRIDNLAELGAALEEYMQLAPEPSLAGFLEEASLATDLDGMAEGGRVSLLTLHTAKGLEFGVVFLPGMEEGLFPHSRSLSDKPALEEERRLCYVGITRGKWEVHLSAARWRVTFGEGSLRDLSRFVGEIPSDLLSLGEGANRVREPARWTPRVVGGYDELAQPELAPAAERVIERREAGSFPPGTRVFHASFGEGQVVGTSGSGSMQKLTIDFPSVGRKVVVARFVEPV